MHAKYDSKDIKRLINLEQIYETLKDENINFTPELQAESIKRYWKTFVIDALVGNFDRHMGNWGYLVRNNNITLAPVYDYGSTLFPQLSDLGVEELLGNEYELLKRSLVFPSPTLVVTTEKVGKVGYYDMLSSNYDHNCTDALLKVMPNINMDKINNIIDNTPLITDVRKQFYKTIIGLRKELILDRAYLRCVYKEYDKDALLRLTTGKQFSEKDLENFQKERNIAKKRLDKISEVLKYSQTAEYAQKLVSGKNIQPINTKELLVKQRHIVENYGFSIPETLNKAYRITSLEKEEKTI